MAKELTIEGLQAALDKKDADHKTAIEKLTAGHTSALDKKDAEHKTAIEKLTAGHSSALDAKDKENAGLKKELDESMGLLADAHAKLSTEDTYTEPSVITVDKKKYRIAFPVFNHGGVQITAAELKENKALAAELVEKNSGILELLK